MTEEQMKSLKVGDTFAVLLEVTAAAERGAAGLLALDAQPVGHEGSHQSHTYDSECLSVVSLGTTPAFEAGDTVRIIPDPLSGRVHGSHYSQLIVGAVGVVVRVHHAGEKDEEGVVDDECTVWIRCKGNTFNWGISPHCVELVDKAAKYKYWVIELPEACHVVYGNSKSNYGFVAIFDKARHPHAKAAAAAECNRLNAELRKKEGGAE